MKVALLGDVHGNHLALEAVLASARKRDAERLLVTGDLVGYYFWPREVLELLAPWNKIVVRGNHEDMLIEVRKRPGMLKQVDEKYGTGLRVALETLSKEQLEWLGKLDHPADIEIDGRKMLLCHGSPWDIDQYIYPDADDTLLQRCVDARYDWVILGHTHYPMEKKIGKVALVNPGSVGQPRNRESGAHWALLDTRTRVVEQFTEAYDVAWIVQQAKTRQPDKPYLWEVLTRT